LNNLIHLYFENKNYGSKIKITLSVFTFNKKYKGYFCPKSNKVNFTITNMHLNFEGMMNVVNQTVPCYNQNFLFHTLIVLFNDTK
jgi:hypothetical protein